MTSAIIANIAKGVSVNAVVTGAVTGAAYGGAVGAAVGIVGAVAIASIPFFIDALARAAVEVAVDGTMTAPDPGACDSTGCYLWTTGSYAAGYFSSRSAACVAENAAYEANRIASGFPPLVGSVVSTVPTCRVNYVYAAGGDAGYRELGYSTSALPPGVDPPSVVLSPADVAARVSTLEPTPAEVQGLVDRGFAPEVGPVSITGPAEVAGMNTVKLGSDGSTETETCKFYLDYFPSTIETRPECTTVTSTPEKTSTATVTVTNPDGSTSTRTISTTTPASTKTVVVSKDAADDKDRVPPEFDTPSGQIPRENVNITYQPDDLGFGSGACPADVVFDAGKGLKYSFADSGLCDTLSGPVKAVVLFLAALSAMFIVMGIPEGNKG
ncbi:MAG: hypothetical protein V4614_11135 [Pseudomonadota bacterium]